MWVSSCSFFKFIIIFKVQLAKFNNFNCVVLVLYYIDNYNFSKGLASKLNHAYFYMLTGN